MTSNPSYPLERVTQLLREEIEEMADVDTLPLRRDVAIGQLADALRARRRLGASRSGDSVSGRPCAALVVASSKEDATIPTQTMRETR